MCLCTFFKTAVVRKSALAGMSGRHRDDGLWRLDLVFAPFNELPWILLSKCWCPSMSAGPAQARCVWQRNGLHYTESKFARFVLFLISFFPPFILQISFYIMQNLASRLFQKLVLSIIVFFLFIVIFLSSFLFKWNNISATQTVRHHKILIECNQPLLILLWKKKGISAVIWESETS